MSSYGKLISRIWSDPDFMALDARPQQIYMMLLSFPTRNYAGVLPLTIRRWSGVCADATQQNVTAALQTLIDARFVVVDWDTEEILIRTYLRNDEVYRQPNVMKAALKDVLNVSSPRLREALGRELLRLPDHQLAENTYEIAKTLVETPPEPLAEPFGEGLPEPPGVGGYVSSNPAPSPIPSPTPAPVTPSPKPSRGTRLPPNWKPPDELIRDTRTKFPHVDLRAEYDKFCDYWHAKAGKDAVKVDWDATWRNWIRRAAEHAPTANGRLSRADEKGLKWLALGRQQPPTQELTQ